MSNTIKLLSNDTINKIAAGEVIENPKSIVKELVENSIDAGSDEIIVEIKNGGKTLIRITDNGKGIPKDEIEDAFKRHCTSKIEDAEDLNSLYTLGFRGEALASVAAVSKVEVISRTKDENYGVKMAIEGGAVTYKDDVGCPVGTTITVTDLFYNVPARKKFLKSDTSESGNINEIVASLSLSKEYISFKYVNNGNIAFKTPKTKDFINTISSLYEVDLYESLVPIEYTSKILKIVGYTSDLNYYRGNRKYQLVFVNGRFIKHKRINFYIEAAYHTLLPKNKYPACFMKIEMDPSIVDVNAHPAKTEVRFQNEELILSEIKNAIFRALRDGDIIKGIKKETIIPENKISISRDSIFEEAIKNQKDDNVGLIIPKTDNIWDDMSTNPVSENPDDAHCNDIWESAIIKEPELDYDYCNPNKEQQEQDNEQKVQETQETQETQEVPNQLKKETKEELETQKQEKQEKQEEQQTFIDIQDDLSLNKNSIPEMNIIGILLDTYIICENRKDYEMYMIDQHAAHERINYEKFLNQYNNREILKQELLIPEVINMSYEDYYTYSSSKHVFENIGLTVESFGINAVLISSIPTVFCDANIKDIFLTVLDALKYVRKVSSDELNSEMAKIIKNACVKSVKSGDKLHLAEVKNLIDDLRKTENPYTCPHGRPVIIKMTKYEIERMFERIQN